MTIYTLIYPTRDVERRKLCGFMLGMISKQTNKFTVEELEEIAVKSGYLKIIKEGAKK